MDTIIAALILAVVGALYKILPNKSNHPAWIQARQPAKQLADVMATVYILSSEAKPSSSQQSASDNRQNQPVTEPITGPYHAAHRVKTPVSAPIPPPPSAPSALPIVASLPMANTLDASTSSSAPNGNAAVRREWRSPPHQPSVSSPSSPSLKDDESATNIVTSLWASATQWFFGKLGGAWGHWCC